MRGENKNVGRILGLDGRLHYNIELTTITKIGVIYVMISSIIMLLMLALIVINKWEIADTKIKVDEIQVHEDNPNANTQNVQR